VPYFSPFRDVVIREEESLFIGELWVECFPGTGSPRFEILSPTPSFVRVFPSECVCGNKIRAQVLVNPRRGDRGSYQALIFFGSCEGPGGQLFFEIRVKKSA